MKLREPHTLAGYALATAVWLSVTAGAAMGGLIYVKVWLFLWSF